MDRPIQSFPTTHCPDGYQIIEHRPRELLVLEYRTSGMGCMLAFLCITVGLFGGGFLIGFVVAPGQVVELISSSWWATLAGVCGALALIHFTFFVLFHLFGFTRMTATQDSLVVSKKLFFFTWTKSVPRASMMLLEQIKDGGEGEDSFPSWGLILKARPRLILLNRQPIKKSDWLGATFAEWFGIPFKTAEKRE